MKPWVYFSMIAAIFIAISDYISFYLFKRIDYIDYIIHANIVAFMGTLLFLIFSNDRLSKITEKDSILIISRVLIIYLIVGPAIYFAMKHSYNPGYAKSIINLNSVFLVIATMIFLQKKPGILKFIGMAFIILGSFILTN